MTRLSPERGLLLNLQGKVKAGTRGYLPQETAHAILCEMSGQDYGYEVSAWREWVSKNKQSFQDGTFARAVLLVELRSADSVIAMQAAQKLGDNGDHASVPALIAALLGDDEWVAIDAAEALGKIGAPEAVPALLQTLLAVNWHQTLREHIESARQAGDKHRMASVAEHLGGSIHDLQINSANALALIGDRRAVPTLIAVAQERSHFLHVRWAAMRALGALKATEAVPLLVSLLSDDDATTVARTSDVAAEALERVGSPDALEAVRNWKDSQ